NTVAIMPTAAQRRGDFSAALNPTVPCNGPDPAGPMICLNQGFDPDTTRLFNNGTTRGTVRTPLAHNVIPPTRIDPTPAIIQGMLPDANSPGLFNYTAPGYSNFRHTTIPSFKIDHNLNDKMKLSAFYSAAKTLSPNNNGFDQAFTAKQSQNALSQTVRI